MADPTPVIGPEPPKKLSVDEVIAELQRIPLFMTNADATVDNPELEAFRALAFEGSRAEVASNFREQGNEAARARQWLDAREFYTKALATLKGPETAEKRVVEEGEEEEVEIDERAVEEACWVNRALCQLELKNYRSCNADCAETLRMNPANVKAWYRSASACLALDKIPEAADACSRGLEVDGTNKALRVLQGKIQARKDYITKVEAARQEREEKEAKEKAAITEALKTRNIPTRKTNSPPNMEDAIIKLASPLDPTSTLSIPMLILYPLASQTDLIKSFEETHSLLDHLSYLIPVPWDTNQEYTLDSIDIYMPTPSSGLIKAGKKLPLQKLLASGKIELVDDMLHAYIVPRAKAAGWISDYKLTQGGRRP
ncbi:TPR repeat protein-like protein [Microthyrium microscopicum]|uniref:TPR repeat protein-like protein n=1 Tax=Microthyrium microscopicum TaxID=703497 RepID=A0A6A6UHE8_9PEZI|nr:TPR repeat protein-like protein [Microthyrium microscopicum]